MGFSRKSTHNLIQTIRIMGLAERTISGVLWSTAGEIIVKFISPVSFLVLTHLLSPSDFGIVAVATTVLMFVNIVSDLGTGKVLIQLKCNDSEFDKYCNASFYFNIIIGICLFLIVFIFSPEIAIYNNTPQAEPVIKVMSVQIVFYALSTVQLAIKNRDLKFKTLFYIRLMTVAAPVLLSIPIAILGGGLWAIVAGSVSSSLFQTIVLWVTSDWKPKYQFKKAYLKSILSKSIWNSLHQILVWVPIGLDTYLISNFISSDGLGLYTTTRSLFTSFSGLILGPILPVIYSSLSKVKENKQFSEVAYFSQKILFSIASVLSLIVFVYSDIITEILFNNQWLGISKLIQIVFLLMGLEYFNSILLEALRAKGRFKELAVINLLSLLIVCPLLYCAASRGIYFYTLIRCLCLYVPFIGVFYFSKKYCEVSFSRCVFNNRYLIMFTLLVVPISVLLKDCSVDLCYYVVCSSLLILGLLLIIKVEKTDILKVYNLFKRSIKR